MALNLTSVRNSERLYVCIVYFRRFSMLSSHSAQFIHVQRLIDRSVYIGMTLTFDISSTGEYFIRKRHSQNDSHTDAE